MMPFALLVRGKDREKDLIYYVVKGKQCVRVYTKPFDPKTDKQLTMRYALGEAASAAMLELAVSTSWQWHLWRTSMRQPSKIPYTAGGFCEKYKGTKLIAKDKTKRGFCNGHCHMVWIDDGWQFWVQLWGWEYPGLRLNAAAKGDKVTVTWYHREGEQLKKDVCLYLPKWEQYLGPVHKGWDDKDIYFIVEMGGVAAMMGVTNIMD